MDTDVGRTGCRHYSCKHHESQYSCFNNYNNYKQHIGDVEGNSQAVIVTLRSSRILIRSITTIYTQKPRNNSSFEIISLSHIYTSGALASAKFMLSYTRQKRMLS